MRLRPSYANVVSTFALVVALSGTAYAAATITGRDVKDSSLSGRDVKNNSLDTRDVKGLTKKDFKAGVLAQGPAGTPGAQGPAGPAGPGAGMEATGAPLVPVSADQSFEMDAELFDTGGMYSAPDDFMTVTQAGTYQVAAALSFSTGGSQRQLRVVVDGVTRARAYDSTPDAQSLELSTLLRLDVGDTVRMGTFNGTGAAISVTDFGSSPDAFVVLQWVGP